MVKINQLTNFTGNQGDVPTKQAGNEFLPQASGSGDAIKATANNNPNATYTHGDVYVNTNNIAFFYSNNADGKGNAGWVKIGELMYKDIDKSIAGGANHSIFLLSDGTVKAVGYNLYGQLGDGTTVDKSTPVLVSGITNAVGVACGYNHSIFLLSDGTVKAVGYNLYGQLGDGTTVDKSTPVLVSGITNAVGVAGGWSHSIFLLSDGTVKAVGYNLYGQLGDGTTVQKTTPVLVSGITNAVGVAGSGHHSIFLLSDGTVKAVGYNLYGQLGDGTTTNRTTPVAVQNVNNVAQGGLITDPNDL